MSIFRNYNELVETGEEGTGRAYVLQILEAGVQSVLPPKVMKDFFENKSVDFPSQVTVFGWGKASLGMFESFRDNLKGGISKGSIITPQDVHTSSSISEFDILKGAHPLPDESSVLSGEKLLDIAGGLDEKDTLVCLISGGGSSMFEVPKEGIDLETLRETYRMLLESGCDIHEMNSVRRALSASKGGSLARAAYPARIINIVISDVIGNNLEDISSGPTAMDPLTIKHLEVVKKYNLEDELDKKVLEVMGKYRPVEDKYFQNVETYIIADNNKAVGSMVQRALSMGFEPTRFEGYLSGEARSAANTFMDTHGDLIIGGGETTVTVKGSGQGGRNQEFVLAGLGKLKGGVLASIGTDGIDGDTEAAGALGDGSISKTAKGKGYDLDVFLENNDSNRFFRECGGLLFSGPTGTNVADICVYLRNKDLLS
jgi:hydroxypyruvate reductase